MRAKVSLTCITCLMPSASTALPRWQRRLISRRAHHLSQEAINQDLGVALAFGGAEQHAQIERGQDVIDDLADLWRGFATLTRALQHRLDLVAPACEGRAACCRVGFGRRRRGQQYPNEHRTLGGRETGGHRLRP